MKIDKRLYLVIVILIFGTLACSVSGIRQQAQTVEQTAQALSTEFGGIVTASGSLLETARALETQHPGVVETAKALASQGAPVISTIQAVGTSNPGLVQTAQAFINKELPSGMPPADIPIINPDQAQNYFGSGQYIIYSTPTDYNQVVDFYKTEMPNNGWQYLLSDSHEYENAAQLNYFKESGVATINISYNPLNYTTAVVISILK